MTGRDAARANLTRALAPLLMLAAAGTLAGCVDTRVSSQASPAAAHIATEGTDITPTTKPEVGGPARAAAAEATSELLIDDTPEGLVQITKPSDGSDFDPAISRDGKFIVFASTQHRRTADIYIKPVGSAAITQLTQDPGNDVMPTISPDGQKIAFCSDRGGTYGIYLMSMRGGQPVQLTSGNTDLHPSFSPDGSHLVFSRLGEASGRWEMWVLDLKRPTTPEFIGHGMFPEFCPTAGTGAGGTDKIAYQKARQRGDSAFSIWTIDYKPGNIGNPTQVVSATDSAAINPTWSPDGNWIAYTAAPITRMRGDSQSAGGMSGGSGQIRISSADGSTRIDLTGGLRQAFMPTWGPENRIFFVSDRGIGGATNARPQGWGNASSGGNMGIWSASPDKALAAASASGTTPMTGGAGAARGGPMTDAQQNPAQPPEQ